MSQFYLQNCKANIFLADISEVIFSADAQSSDPSDTNGLSMSEIVAIGICSVLLGLIYVASVFLYLHIRRKRKYNDSKMEIRDNHNISNAEEGIIKSNPLLVLGRHFPNPDTGFSDTTESDTDAAPDVLQHPDDRKKNVTISSKIIYYCYYSFSCLDTTDFCYGASLQAS